jgi:hypothetical protein
MSFEETLLEKLNNYFEKDSQNIFDQLALYIYQHETKETDLYILAKLLPHESLIKVINFFNGDVIKIPTKIQFKECYLTSICFYLREIKKWEWNQIKKSLNLSEEDFNTYGIGRRINAIKDSLAKDILIALKMLVEKEKNSNG